MRYFTIKHNNKIYKLKFNDAFSFNNNVLNIKSSMNNYSVTFSEFKIKFNDGDFYIIDKNVYDLYIKNKYKIPIKNKMIIKSTENNKDIKTVLKVYKKLNKLQFNKSNTVWAIGGGIIQDITTFVSNTYKRGLKWNFYPTTLLSMTDSCIGAKSGINYMGIKNQIACYNAPNKILIDIDFLNSLSKEQLFSGIYEMLKLSIIGNSFDLFKKYILDTDDLNLENIKKIIIISLKIKKEIIEKDEFDKNIRLSLNYGHTFGHAIEKITKNRIPHGHAVLIGMKIMDQIFKSSNILNEFLPLFNKYDISKINLKTENLFKYINHDKKVEFDEISIVYYNVTKKITVIKKINLIELKKLFEQINFRK